MITYEQIKKANDTIITTDIKGKDYAEVNQRIKAFRMVYPTGSIGTNIVSIENGVCIMNAQVGYTDENNNYIILGEGTAYEKENSTFINKTSYIENCETSAVGRALGMAGFGIDTSVASYEEVATAIANQDKPKAKETKTEPKKEDKKDEEKSEFVNADQVAELKAKMKEDGVTADFILNSFGIKSFKEMTVTQFENTMNYWSRVLKKFNEV